MAGSKALTRGFCGLATSCGAATSCWVLRPSRRLLGDIPSSLLGLNEPEDGGRLTTSWDDLRACFRSHRVYLNTTVDLFEDGYNLAMLEAMATGMPVATTPNRTSPIVDGDNGFVSGDLSCLRDRIVMLLGNIDAARTMGARARQTVAERFPIDLFVQSWNRVLERASGNRRLARPRVRSDVARSEDGSTPERKKILLAYASHPSCGARYLETSLRKPHDVVTVGPGAPQQLPNQSELERLPDSVRLHDIPCGFDVDISRLADRLARKWTPDLFLWIESAAEFFPAGMERLECETACYVTEPHVDLDRLVEWARRFDRVFLAQRELIPAFVDAGCSCVSWLPLACDPEIHGAVPGPIRHDVMLVGSLTTNDPQRRASLDRLSGRVDVRDERSSPSGIAAGMSASRLVINVAEHDGLSMRVFEALASGSCLITDRAPGSGLDEMFTDREHLVICGDGSLEDVVDYYLSHDDERERIASRGRHEVLKWHTYDYRAGDLMSTVLAGTRTHDIGPAALGSLDDALVIDAMDLAGRGEWDRALARLELISEQRDLNDAERLAGLNTKAACLEALGRTLEAQSCSSRAMGSVTARCRDQLLWSR